jgi:hypothetical protein
MFHLAQAPSLRRSHNRWRSCLKEVTMVASGEPEMHLQPVTKLSSHRGAPRIFRFYNHERSDEVLNFCAPRELYTKTKAMFALVSKAIEMKHRPDQRVLS